MITTITKKSWRWAKDSLFSSPLNIALTVVSIYLIYVALPPALNWLFINADFLGETRADCSRVGACWVVVKENIKLIFYGRYSHDLIWRPNLALLLLVLLVIPLFMKRFSQRFKVFLGGGILFIYPFIAYWLIHGSLFGIALFDEVIPTDLWGGFMLTLVLASVGIVASLPIGIILALGRRSSMPIISRVCIIFIEFWRGVPLITVLFMASVMLPLFFPEGTHFEKLSRALIGITLFQSAYMAEVIRGGLQAIPRGQFEAADALGLSYWKKMGLIILPQALKIVIPGIVNTFIALFKDTSLVSIIGMWDLLSVSQKIPQNQNWLEFQFEPLVFAALIFFLCCFSISKYSQSIERKLNTEHKR